MRERVIIPDLPVPPLVLWPAVLVVGLAVLVRAADRFTDTAERLGLAFRLSPFIVGAAIVAVGTSLPELVSSVLAVLRGAPEIVPGNVVGSNVANLLLVLGVAAVVVGGVRVRYELVAVDLPFLAASGFFLALILWDGTVTLAEGGFCLFGLALYLRYAVSGRPPRGGDAGERGATAERGAALLKPAAVLVISGALIYLGADFTVLSVVEISRLLGIGGEVIAASAVALGTSLPEVTVAVTAVRQGRAEMAVGNVIGSNVLNVFGVIGISALIGPLPVAESILRFALPVMIIATVLSFFMLLERDMTRWEGWLMLMLYVYFLGALYGVV